MGESKAATAMERVRGEQVRVLYSNVPVAVGAGAGGCIVMVAGLIATGRTDTATGAFWIASTVVCSVFHLGLWAAFGRARPADAAMRPWFVLFVLACLAEGVSSGVGALYLTRPDRLEQELIVLLVAVAMAGSAVTFYGASRLAFAAFFLPTMAPHLLFGLSYRYRLHEVLGGMTALFVLFLSVTAWRFHRQFAENVRLRFENVDLLAEVNRQRERAEEANLAKSRFLASASHDLRQPLHALSLFVGALSLRRLDAETRRLLGNVSDSVSAMDGLFGALLDISKLDAGATRVEPRTFALRPVMARLCADLAASAEAKGLTLRTRLAEATLHTDPFLLECIVRNLVANAVRYTDRGGVLVSVRPRAGRVRIEVWDTGSGIAPDQQAHIFQEFYQAPRPEAHRAQGLGLGLAIVQRLAELLGAQVSLASRPGRGSVFRVDLPPAGNAVTPAEPVAEPAALPRPTGLILVLDDEPAVRSGMESLLGGWGYQVLSARSGAEMLARMPSGADPGLIICDYGLGEEDGAEVIGRLRARLGRAAPALLVTGDTRPERMAQAQAAGLPLLHKPVSNARLRAAIGNLMQTPR